jgi:hypothetical protein
VSRLPRARAHAEGSQAVRAVRTAIVLAAIGLVLCLWLLAGVNWYNFSAFMLLAQPLLILALLIFVGAVVKVLRERGVL